MFGGGDCRDVNFPGISSIDWLAIRTDGQARHFKKKKKGNNYPVVVQREIQKVLSDFLLMHVYTEYIYRNYNAVIFSGLS